MIKAKWHRNNIHDTDTKSRNHIINVTLDVDKVLYLFKKVIWLKLKIIS